MSKAKKIVSFALCLVLIFALSVTAFADYGIAPSATNSAATHYISGSNVHLRSGPGSNYSSGGLLQKNDECHFTTDSAGRTIVVDGDITWGHIHMDSGKNVGKSGYASCKYIQEIYSYC